MILDYSKKELDQIAKLYGVKGAYKLKKAELVEALLEAIPAGIAENLPMLDESDIQKFEALMKESKVVQGEDALEGYYNLMELELVQAKDTEEGKVLCVDELIKEAYSKLDMTPIMKQIKENSELRKYVMGILNLYGVVKLDWAVELYQSLYKKELTEADFTKFVKKDMRIACQSKIIEDHLVEETIYALDKNNFYEFIKATEGKNYYVPTKDMINAFSDETYYEKTVQVEKLKTYLRQNFTQDEHTINECVVAVSMISRVDCDRTGKTIELMLEEMANLGIEFKDMMAISETVKYVVAVANNTRKWINKGFTALEVSPHTFDEKTGQKVKKLDIGRNAPCPCGSGKKYKKCCGN